MLNKKMIMKKLLQLIFIAIAMVSITTAQTPVVETFDYDAGPADGLGAAENGWGGAWVFVGNTDNVNIAEGLLQEINWKLMQLKDCIQELTEN
jgi:hypothetical protein